MATFPVSDLLDKTRSLSVTIAGSAVKEKTITTTDLAASANFTSSIYDSFSEEAGAIGLAINSDQPTEVQLQTSSDPSFSSSTIGKSYALTLPAAYTADERTVVVPFVFPESRYYRIFVKNAGASTTSGLSVIQYYARELVKVEKYFHVLLEIGNGIRDTSSYDLIYTNLSSFTGQKHLYISNGLDQTAVVTIEIGIGQGFGSGIDVDVIEYEIGAGLNKLLTYADLPILAGGFERIRGSIQCATAPTSGEIRVSMGVS